MSADRVARLERRLSRERAIRVEAERLLETKALELFDANRDLELLNQDLELRVAGRTRELERERRRAVRLSEQDALTGAANRAKFQTHLDQVLTAAAAKGEQVALLVFDIDKFKQVNDTFGHLCGDALLIAIADRVSTLLREGCLLARLGGDEFAVVATFPSSARTGARSLAKRIAAALDRPFRADGRIVRTAATVGIAISPDHAQSAGDLQRFADLALYAGKLNGRRQVMIFNSLMRREFEARWLMEERLRADIARQGIAVAYQPILNLRTGRIAGVEALARWTHPATGDVSPDTFIQIAEENQLIRDLGRQVLVRACTDTQPWLKSGQIDFFSVNLSPIQVQDSDQVAELLASLSDLRVDPSTLVLEVTERLLLFDSATVRLSLDSLRNRGIRLALDDFGAGFSNLSYLKRLPIDRIKIDRSLVTGIESEGFARIIVHSVTDLAHRLGLKVIAEGVETTAQRAELAALGCDYAQGYWLSQPLPALEMADLLAAGMPECA